MTSEVRTGDGREGGGWGPQAPMARVGVDVGGTFTDLVAVVDGAFRTFKVPSTPHDQSVGVLAALEGSGVDLGRVAVLAHGSTVATNALLERRGARTTLVTTAGFRDVIEIGRQDRAALYDLAARRPAPLVPRERRCVVVERMGPDGVVVPLEPSAVAEVVEALRGLEPEAVAVCLLFSFAHPQHEQELASAIRRDLPDAHVSVSSEVVAEFREFERFSTTVADAYLAPVISRYLSNLTEKVVSAGLPAPLVMQSSGGVLPAAEAARRPAAFLLSGPAGGVVGAAYVAAASGHRDVLTFDMGGTSTDVAAVLGGAVQSTTESVVAGVPIKLPMVDIHTVSAGGGSIAWVDPGGVLRVGPTSAGAVPGPACYDRGGEQATVTDANLVLGYLADEMELGGAIRIREENAVAALRVLGRRLGLDPAEVAAGIVRVANAEMTRALRVISVERGLDPRRFVLLAFGGAGPLHACDVAEELGMERVLVPKASGVLSALGLAISNLRRDYVTAGRGPLDNSSRGRLVAAFVEMERAAEKDLSDPLTRRFADLRYRGQSFELTVTADDLDALGEAFHAAHELRYGYRSPHEAIEVTCVRVVATVEVPKPPLDELPPSGPATVGSRLVKFANGWVDTPVMDRRLMGHGSIVTGPVIVEMAEATCVVRPAWRGSVDGVGTLILERAQ